MMKLFSKKAQVGEFIIPLILPLIILLIIGLPFVMTVMKFLNSPVVNGYVPVWAILAVGLVFLYIRKNRYRWGLARDRRIPPRY